MGDILGEGTESRAAEGRTSQVRDLPKRRYAGRIARTQCTCPPIPDIPHPHCPTFCAVHQLELRTIGLAFGSWHGFIPSQPLTKFKKGKVFAE